MVSRFSSRDGRSSYDEPRSGRARWIVPLVTFLLGALLGGVGIGLVMRGGDEPAPVTAAPTTATPTSPADQVAVPRACLKIADEAEVLQGQLDQAMEAARDLDAARLAEMVRGIDEQQASLRKNTETCRRGAATATAVTPGTTVTSTVTVAPAPATTEPASPEPAPQTPEATATPKATPKTSGTKTD